MREPQSWVDIAAYLNRLPIAHFTEVGNGTDVAFGRKLFQAQCASCHYGYLVNQLHQLGREARHNVDKELVLFIRNFDEGEICAVADYLSRLRGPVKHRDSMRTDGTVVD